MAMINTYLGFSIVATVFAGVLLICYGLGVSYITRSRPSCTRYVHTNCDYSPYRCDIERVTDSECQISVGLGAMIIIFAVIEFGVGIWSSICCCMGCDGCCCDTSTPRQMGQIVYLQTQEGPVAAYVMTQGPNGMPVAVPAMTGGPVYPAPNQSVGGQGYVMQNRPQGATAVTTTQYDQGDVTNSGDQQPSGKTTGASSEPPPVYMP
ncbi:uncharacterized protein LOC116290074 [Actinia tenebrosa]|uniref:Uncharacterized protein LOC116290074 n=1 Tax=Actinia tenebrosa TaxID=6105 RepID=A0A6P8HBC3_ACTTE|nr:uncharacterized protein LOC116290074 [Actinia tenebrosa]